MVIFSGGGTVDFQEFVGGLSAFSSRGGRDEKLRCQYYLQPPDRSTFNDLHSVAFKVYDMDRDGYISNGELFLVLKMMVGNNLKVGNSDEDAIHQTDGQLLRILNYSKLWTRR